MYTMPSAPSIVSDYIDIQREWKKGMGNLDIYHMIVVWVHRWRSDITDQEGVDDLLERIDDDDSTNAIVEDFIHGERYDELREQFIYELTEELSEDSQSDQEMK